MPVHPRSAICAVAAASGLAALVAMTDSRADDAPPGFGSNLTLPAPEQSWIPTVKVATAIGWPADGKPTPAAGLKVEALATGLDHPRWLYVLPNGDVLVAETNKPDGTGKSAGIRTWFMSCFRGKVGTGAATANRITLLRGLKPDGTAAETHVFLKDLHSPFGMALVGDTFYVANTDAVVKFPYKTGDTTITAAAEKVADLPGGKLNHHWTKNLIASRDGTKLFATVGSNSNIAGDGMAVEKDRAAILEIDIASGATRVFASGLRNPNGLDFEPKTGALWTAVNERDELGNDLVPDYMTSVTDGGFYGWPYSYFGKNVDTRVTPQDPALVAKAIVPDYALGAHTFARARLRPCRSLALDL